MKAAIYKEIGKIEIEEVSNPVLTDDEVLLRVEVVGICGTDIKTYKRGHPLFRPPCILGHEVVGTVVKVNTVADNELLGRKFAVPPYLGCGECEFCKKGFSELCRNKIWINGAFVEYLVVPTGLIRRTMAEVDMKINDAIATLTEPLACVIHGIERIKPREQERILVIGAGPMGILASILLRNRNNQVFLSEINENRLALAQTMKFETINVNMVSLTDFSSKMGKFDHIIVANDSTDAVIEAFNCVKPGGKIELFGGMSRSSRLSIDPYYIHYDEIDLIGSFGFSDQDFKNAFQELKIHQNMYAKLITGEFNLNEIEKAFQAAANPSNLKIVVRIS